MTSNTDLLARQPSVGNFPKVCFVVVNWNQRQLTLDCLASLAEQNYRNYSVTVVDNGSDDGSVPAVRAAFPDTVVLENGANMGIAYANNVGIRYALAAKADYVFLLNNDTVVDPDMLRRLVAVAESEPSIGATGPTMLYYDHPEIIWCAGNRIDWRDGSTYRLGAEQRFVFMETTAPCAVDFITSCAVCIKRAALEELGLMDERYFIYYDETDWFARAAAAGWRTVYVPQAMMWHKVSATMGESSPITDYYMIRNKFLFLQKNLSGLSKTFALSRAGAQTLLTIAAYTLKNQRGQRLRNRNAKWMGLRDASLGRWGRLGADI